MDDELRERVALEVAISHGCTLESAYGASHRARFLKAADRILTMLRNEGRLVENGK